MHPILFSIGHITIYSYGIIFAAAFVTGIYLAQKKAACSGIESKIIVDLGVYLLISSLVGARLFYIMDNLEWYIKHPAEIVFSRTGFVFYGGFILAITVGIWYLRRHKLPVLKIADIFGPSIAIGEAIGRIGCFLHGCCYGRPTSPPWGICFPEDAPAGSVVVHPTQIYLSVANVIVFIILSMIKPGFTGKICSLYLILHALFRFVIEYWRGDSASVFLGLTGAQLISVLLGICGVVLWIKAKQKENTQIAQIKKESRDI
ncbi:prolipoprotein diacylglyceryl transferase [bacterium]|nr:prolipoprotein diacylglyceryl transferase [bacterium]MBU1752954.1 prolipoprotein diacylglyceryl transferase [bacterium]